MGRLVHCAVVGAALVVLLSACANLGEPGASVASGTIATPTTDLATPSAPAASTEGPTESLSATDTPAPATDTPAPPTLTPSPAVTPRPSRSKSPRPTSSPTATATATAPSPTITPPPTRPPQPDLIVKTFSVPTSVTHGVEATGAMYVQNVGPADAGPFSVDIFGSCPQEVFSQAPKEVPGLAAGADKFIRIAFTFEKTGACTVGATIDSSNQVQETNESNNDVSVSVTSQ